MIDSSGISEPTLLLDVEKCRANLERMATKAKENNVILRPHCKTHQSHGIARWFRDFEIDRITVSSVKMAHYFANDAWRDITIAFPLNIREIKAIDELASQIDLKLIVENPESVAALASTLNHHLQVFIKADIGYGRTGIADPASPLIEQILQEIDRSSKISFLGFLGHAGHSYKCRSHQEIQVVHENSISRIQAFRSRYRDQFPDLTISVGDTPTCSVMNQFSEIDEIRPGNFVFYDLTQWQISSCRLGDIAVAIACPVVARHESRNELVIYGGGVHLSKDRLQMPDGRTIFGLVGTWRNSEWQIRPEASYLRSLSQEHGIIVANEELMQSVRVGDLLPIVPVHSCMAANSMKKFLTVNGEAINMMS